MRAYLRGELDALDAIEVDTGGTEFQQQVWTMLRKMAKPEKTITYGELARPSAANASRAVGAANGQNPISIVIPCHRVIRSTAHSPATAAACPQGMAPRPRRREAGGDARQPAVLTNG